MLKNVLRTLCWLLTLSVQIQLLQTSKSATILGDKIVEIISCFSQCWCRASERNFFLNEVSCTKSFSFISDSALFGVCYYECFCKNKHLYLYLVIMWHPQLPWEKKEKKICVFPFSSLHKVSCVVSKPVRSRNMFLFFSTVNNNSKWKTNFQKQKKV